MPVRLGQRVHAYERYLRTLRQVRDHDHSRSVWLARSVQQKWAMSGVWRVITEEILPKVACSENGGCGNEGIHGIPSISIHKEHFPKNTSYRLARTVVIEKSNVREQRAINGTQKAEQVKHKDGGGVDNTRLKSMKAAGQQSAQVWEVNQLDIECPWRKKKRWRAGAMRGWGPGTGFPSRCGRVTSRGGVRDAKLRMKS